MPRLRISCVCSLVLAALGWLAVMVALFYGGEVIYASPAPLRPAYNIAGNADDAAPPAAKAEPAIPAQTLAERLQQADINQGRKVFGQCAACHTASADGANRVGPNLWRIVGRSAGSVADFRYSQAMRRFAASGGKWDIATLDAFLTAPAGFLAGTTMSFAGVKQQEERADLLLYLETLTDKSSTP